jgi:hypothetical protein
LNWSEERPRQSGVYWYLDHHDQLAEDISIVEVNLEAGQGGEVYRSGFRPAPFPQFHGIWCGPFAPLPARR